MTWRAGVREQRTYVRRVCKSTRRHAHARTPACTGPVEYRAPRAHAGGREGHLGAIGVRPLVRHAHNAARCELEFLHYFVLEVLPIDTLACVRAFVGDASEGVGDCC